MPSVTHVFWRDIPAQVIVGKGRSASKAVLPERFEQAIDRCAMKIGAKDAEAYLAEWRRVPVGPRSPGEHCRDRPSRPRMALMPRLSTRTERP